MIRYIKQNKANFLKQNLQLSVLVEMDLFSALRPQTEMDPYLALSLQKEMNLFLVLRQNEEVWSSQC